MDLATEAMPAGRPTKYPGEKMKALSVRLPESALQYLGADRTQQRENARAAILFEKELSEALGPDALKALRFSAAEAGQSFETDRVETLVRLTLLGLRIEKASKE